MTRPYVSETDQSEHRGFANLLRGIFGTFRNPPAHAARPAAEWAITEADALDLFSVLSFVHRRLPVKRSLVAYDYCSIYRSSI